MSWADEYLMGSYYDGSDRVRDWKNGIHVIKDGSEIKIESMTENHLKNTIKYFKRLDTSFLKKELKNRGESKWV